MHILRIFFSFFGVLNLDIFSLEMLRWFLVCVICNSSRFHSFIFKLCIMIEHVHPYLCTFDYIFLSVQIRNVTSPTVDYIVKFGCLI